MNAKRQCTCLFPSLSSFLAAVVLVACSLSTHAQTAAPSTPNEPDVSKELQVLRERVDQLEAELDRVKATQQQPSVSPKLVNAVEIETVPTQADETQSSASTATTAKELTKPKPAEPFVYADWTWLNGNPRTKDLVWDSKFFTPEIRFDTHFVSSFNHPRDDTLGGSTEIFRSNEIQVEQISFGGDFHWQNVRGRVLTLGGMFGVTTPRNDGSVARGQWDLRGAYRYFGEAYGGYHWDVNHGLNVDGGIFVSYIGLFSYYNFDNWAYQPSYVSSNTPWFFNGVRIQWFPTDKLKIEPWIINGWQSYARSNSKPGLGGQILWRPKPWLSLVFNNYGLGQDTIGLRRTRLHTDDSIQIKYYDDPNRALDKAAFSLTGDLGCESGGGVSCTGNGKNGPKQSFAGWMLYNRLWFHKDLFGLTVGGGVMDNPGRYLTLLPPINGADAVSGSPYFPTGPGTNFKAWDTSLTFDYMPAQYVTFRWEYGYRHANVPYFTGSNGITPPGGNNGAPAQFACLDGTPDPTGLCAGHGGRWIPDMRRNEPSLRVAVLVKF